MQLVYNPGMTTLDKSYAYEELLMVHDGTKIEEISMPEGYTLANHALDYKEDWCKMMLHHGMFFSEQEVQDYWNKMVQQNAAFLDQNFFIALDAQGNMAGAAGLWPGTHFGRESMRLHYLAVDEAHQNRGLATALVIHALNVHQKRSRDPLYLSTQAQSWPAIVLYEKLGFHPWMEQTAFCSKEQSAAAWNKAKSLVYEKEKVWI